MPVIGENEITFTCTLKLTLGDGGKLTVHQRVNWPGRESLEGNSRLMGWQSVGLVFALRFAADEFEKLNPERPTQ